VECVLRPGVVLRVRTGAGNNGEGVAAGGGSGMRGARAGGQQGRGIGLEQEEENDAWKSFQQEVARRRRQSGGQGRGTAPAAGGAEQRSTCSRKKKGVEGSGGPVWKSQEF
jgi:hypothetical protein